MGTSTYSPPKQRFWYTCIGFLLWIVNLVEVLLRFRTMDFPAALVAGMIFLLLPLELWREWYGA